MQTTYLHLVGNRISVREDGPELTALLRPFPKRQIASKHKQGQNHQHNRGDESQARARNLIAGCTVRMRTTLSTDKITEGLDAHPTVNPSQTVPATGCDVAAALTRAAAVRADAPSCRTVGGGVGAASDVNVVRHASKVARHNGKVGELNGKQFVV